MVDALTSVGTGNRSIAMHRSRGLNGVGLAAVDLKAAIRDRALDEQIGCLDGERLQEEDAS